MRNRLHQWMDANKAGREGAVFHASDDRVLALLKATAGILDPRAGQEEVVVYVEALRAVEGALSAPPASEPKGPLFGILAGEPEIIGQRCADGGTCHHRCATECFRKDGCVPLTGSGLRYDWSAPNNFKQED